jgi:quercetin dioxygenase-like cupin family protein
MALACSGEAWLTRDHSDRIILGGASGAVEVLTVAAGESESPGFQMCEKVGYVLDGSVDFYIRDRDGDLYGQSLDAGSFLRVPSGAVHWLRNRRAEPARVVSGIGHLGSEWSISDQYRSLGASWEDKDAFPKVPVRWVAAHQYAAGDDECELALSDRPPTGLVKTAEEVPSFSTSHLTTQMVCGERMSIMVADRHGNYHSIPHVHLAEQMNLVLGGEIKIYALGPSGERHGNRIRKGDFSRVPEMSPHWAWCESGTKTRLLEFHFPGLHGDPELARGVVPLTGGTDQFEPPARGATNIYIEGIDVTAAEASLEEV